MVHEHGSGASPDALREKRGRSDSRQSGAMLLPVPTALVQKLRMAFV